MGQKVARVERKTGEVEYWIWCPGCNTHHNFDKRWTFNGDYDRPTFSPSYLCNFGYDSQCHSFVTDGKIQFLGDCTHTLAGQTVDLGEIHLAGAA